VIHGPDVAAWFNFVHVSRLDLMSLDRVLNLTDLVGIDCPGGVNSLGVFSKFENFLWNFGDFELAGFPDGFCIG